MKTKKNVSGWNMKCIKLQVSSSIEKSYFTTSLHEKCHHAVPGPDDATQNEHNFEVKTNSDAISIKETAFLTLARTMPSEDLISDILQIYEWTQRQSEAVRMPLNLVFMCAFVRRED